MSPLRRFFRKPKRSAQPPLAAGRDAEVALGELVETLDRQGFLRQREPLP